jgi:BirA family biotin operon repressor/biotin-[acetyl-CoA-carboxylase] ligase
VNALFAQNPLFFSFLFVESTIDKTFELLQMQENQNQIIVVTADEQTKGRGRNKKNWFGEKKQNLYFSIGFKHSVKNLPIYLLQMLGGLSVLEVLQNLLTKNQIIRLKYPNDVYASLSSNKDLKKISGIITETNFLDEQNCFSVIGIGINNKQTDFPFDIQENVTSLKNLDIDISCENLTKILTSKIIELLNQSPEIIFSEWKLCINIFDKKINIISDNDCENYYVRTILEDGRLELLTVSGESRIINNGDSIRYNLL